jgi:hypothetical protein
MNDLKKLKRVIRKKKYASLRRDKKLYKMMRHIKYALGAIKNPFLTLGEKMKIEDKYYEDKHHFFALCDGCGSKTWREAEGEVNSLEEDGSQLVPKTIADFLFEGETDKYPMCQECEKKISAISFKTIPTRERQKVAKMTHEQRKQWMINLKIVGELKKGW